MPKIQRPEPNEQLALIRKSGAKRAVALVAPLKDLIFILANRHLFSAEELEQAKKHANSLGIRLSGDFDPTISRDPSVLVVEVAAEEEEDERKAA